MSNVNQAEKKTTPEEAAVYEAAIKKVGKDNMFVRIKQCVVVLAVTGITAFACVYFDSPNYLWLLLMLILAY